MRERIIVHQGAYHDSAFLMRVSRELETLARQAVVVMGTDMNRELLAGAGFTFERVAVATPLDMVVALKADSEEALDRAEAELAKLLAGTSAGGAARDLTRYGDLDDALQDHPEANLISVSVPGAYAAWVAARALDAGRHVFLFSNNVSIEDELALKRRGREHGLLVMGPDCGTAILDGIGLGFANRVSRGVIGMVGASGTGIQEISSLIDELGEGVSHAIGTGSQDLSAKVGGLMTELGLELLARDPATRVVVVVAKHPAEEVAAKIHERLAKLGKPAVVRYLGRRARTSADGVLYAATLDEAAHLAVAIARGQAIAPDDDGTPDETAIRILAGRSSLPGRLVGLFGGGSLCAEARLMLELHGLEANEPDHPLSLEGSVAEPGHILVDTGEDFYTLGKPHPMVDQTVRCALLRKAVADPSVGLVLLDLVLGDGAHLDPAPEMVAALEAGRAARPGDPPIVVASVTGTPHDPQNLSRQCLALERAGVWVADSATHAARQAAFLLGGKPPTPPCRSPERSSR